MTPITLISVPDEVSKTNEYCFLEMEVNKIALEEPREATGLCQWHTLNTQPAKGSSGGLKRKGNS